MKKKPVKATTTVIFKDVPKSLWTHFRAWCVLRNVTAKEMFNQFLKDTIQRRMPGEEK